MTRAGLVTGVLRLCISGCKLAALDEHQGDEGVVSAKKKNGKGFRPCRSFIQALLGLKFTSAS